MMSKEKKGNKEPKKPKQDPKDKKEKKDPKRYNGSWVYYLDERQPWRETHLHSKNDERNERWEKGLSSPYLHARGIQQIKAWQYPW